MYAIRQMDTLRFFWGWDNQYNPPKPKISVHRKLLQYFNTLEEAQQMCRRLGEDYEVVILSYQPMGLRRPKSYNGSHV